MDKKIEAAVQKAWGSGISPKNGKSNGLENGK